MGHIHPLRCEVKDLVKYRERWNSCVDGAGIPAFLRAEFLIRAVEHLGCPGGVLVLGLDGETLAWGAVMIPIGFGRWQTWQPSQLPLGAVVRRRDVDWTVLANGVRRALPGLPLQIAMTQQDPDYFVKPAESGNLEVVDYIFTARISICGTYEDFWNARGKNLKQNLGKQRRKLEEQGVLAFEYIDEPEQVDQAFVDFARLESIGWKSQEGTAVSDDNQQGKFYRSMLQDYSAIGRAFALRLTYNGVAIAVDFGVRDSDSVIILKTTYDETFKASSPAQLLHQSAFQVLFQMKLQRIEFYGKVMEWHTRWTEESRVLYHVNYYTSPLLRFIRRKIRKQGASPTNVSSAP